MDKIAFYIYFGLMGLAFCITVFYFLPVFLNEIDKSIKRKHFIRALNKAYEIEPPKWEHVEIIAKANRLNMECKKEALETMLRATITTKEAFTEDKLSYLEKQIEKIKSKEPFEGIPDNIKIHLEHIENMSSGNGYDLQPLANELREYNLSKIKERKFNKFIAVISLLVGLIGTVFGGISYYENDSSEAAIVNPNKALKSDS